MAGRELYNVDININVNGVDKGTAELKKMDKELSKLEKKAKKAIRPRVDMSGLNRSFSKMANKTNSSFYKAMTDMSAMSNKMAGKSNSAFYRMATGSNIATKRMQENMRQTERMMKYSSVSTQKLLDSQAKRFKQNSIFKNSTMDLMMGKASMLGGSPIKITATENVTKTVAKVRTSIQNLKSASNVKATIKANNNRAIQKIQETKHKAREYASGKYEALLTARDKLSGTVYGRMHRAVGGAIRRVGRIASIGASALGGIGLTSMIKTFTDYTSQMSKLKAVTDMTAREFRMLDKQAKDLGKSTEWSASQVAQGMTELGQAGFASKEIYQAMPGLLNLASAGGLQLGEATSIASGTLRAFNLEASKTGHVANVLAKTASATNSEVNEIGNSMEYAAPYAKMLNVSLEDTAAAIGMLSQVNIKGSKAGMGLRGMFTSLMAPTAGAKKVMDKYGFSAFDATGKMKPFPQVIQELDKSLSKLNPQQKGAAINKMFGDIAGGSIQALLNLGPDKLAKLTKELEYSQGAAQKMAATRLDNLKGDFTILKSAVEGMMISLGTKLEPHMRRFVQWLTNKIPDIEKALSKGIDFFANNWDLILGGLKTAIPLILGIHGAIEGLRGIMFLNNAVRDFGILKEVLAGIFGASSSAGGAVSALKGGLLGISASTAGIFAVVSALTILGVAISDNVDMVAQLQGALGDLGSGIAGTLESIGGLYKMTLKPIGDFLLGSTKMLGAIATGDFESANAAASHMFADMRASWVDGTSDLTKQTTKAMKAIRHMSTEELRPLKETFATALGQQKNIVAGKYKEMGQAVSLSMKGMSDDQINILRGTSRNMEQLLTRVNSTMGEVERAKKIGSNMEKLSRVSGFSPDNMTSDFKTAMSKLEKYSGSAIRNMKADFSNIFNGFKDIAMAGDIQGGVQRMVENIRSAGPAIQSAIQSNKTAMEGMFKGVDFNTMGIQQQTEQIMKNIGNMNPAQATEAMRGIFTQLGNSMSQQAQQVKQAYTNMYNGASNSVSQQAQSQMQASMTQNNQMVTQANQMAQQVKQAYTNMYNGASNSVSQLASRTSSTFSSLSASATSQVSAMCSRIIALWNAMKAVVSATVTAHFVLSVSTVGGFGGAVPHAEGGILTQPHIGLVAEAGPEAVIPLSPGKRARGLELFKQAGEMLGVKQSSDGNVNNGIADGIADKNFGNNNNPRPVGYDSGNTNNVNVNVNVNAGGANNKEEIIDEAVERVRAELEDAFDNLS